MFAEREGSSYEVERDEARGAGDRRSGQAVAENEGDGGVTVVEVRYATKALGDPTAITVDPGKRDCRFVPPPTFNSRIGEPAFFDQVDRKDALHVVKALGDRTGVDL